MIDLPDVNLWVALVDQRHFHHSLAKTYWNQNKSREIGFCRITMLGFLRIITNPKAVANPKTSSQAWTIFNELMALPNVQFLVEPAALDSHFHELTRQPSFPHRLWTDAYLAAFAIACHARLTSFDSGFERFPSLNFLNLDC